MISDVIRTAVHWWCAERSNLGTDHPIRSILPFVFQTLDSLYIATRGIPSPWTNIIPAGVKMGGTNNFIIDIPLSPKDYALLRAVLSLTSDLYSLLTPLKKTGNLMELSSPLLQLHRNTKQFKDVRDFFTHLDERLSKLSVHGITGATKTNCGVEYTDTAQECFHLRLIGDKIHFTSYRKAMEVDVGKSAFDFIFESARLIYSKIISHKIHKGDYESATSIYPI